MSILLTGAAGFIGSHVALRLLERGETVIGVDNLNDYYDPDLKKSRLSYLNDHGNFTFYLGDITDRNTLANATAGNNINIVLHLAAQAGVRYSIDNPRAYINSNIIGHFEVLEFCRHLDSLDHLAYASSSSIYGNNTKIPFHELDNVDHPVSLYAATKKSCELMSYTYAHIFGIPQTGLRYFTVYGPWGRPDMAYWTFTENIVNGKPIRVFNHGDMWRDFTYIDDIVDGTLRVLESPPESLSPPHIVYNIGHNEPQNLEYFIELLEKYLGIEAEKIYEPLQPGDVQKTYADISRLQNDFSFTASTPLEEGLRKFVDWYKKQYLNK